MHPSNLAPLTLEGWFLLHQFFRLPPAPEDDAGHEDAVARIAALAELLAQWEEPDDDGWSGLYRIVGGSTDYMLVHFRPTLEALGDVERTLRRHPSSRDLVLTGDYVSVTELALYHLTARLLEEAREGGIDPGSGEWDELVEDRLAAEREKRHVRQRLYSGEWDELVEDRLAAEREKRHVRQRLYPTQPDEMPYICFYPMDKRRNRGQNWYRLPVEERASIMQEHGATGRRYAGRISQVISGSVGLDDWEWGVTLFGGDPLDFKDLITEMRYDEVSAVYAEFGSFWVGHRIPAAEAPGELAP